MRFLSFLSVLAMGTLLPAQENPSTEADYYRLLTLPIPEELVLEIGGMELLPDGKLAVATRRGDIYLVNNALTDPIEKVTYQLYAEGLHEILGLDFKNGSLYATHRCEVTKLTDEDGDGQADLFDTVSAAWGITGDYHEYAFGSDFDAEGNIWVVLCLTGSFSSEAKYRGWCLRITPEGHVIPTCSGIRSPGGIESNHKGEMFFTENQGPWNGMCALKHLKPGGFVGHPAGFRWYDLPEVANVMGPKPLEPESGSRIHIQCERIPELVPPAILFPYKKMGQSASGIACDESDGKFGPFAHQMFVGDQSASTVMRVYLEEVNGVYQGACFPFREGFASGTLPLEMMPDGTMMVGGTNRGWGSRGPAPFSLERLIWTGKVPFEIHEMHIQPDGFELTFTQSIDAATAADVASYTIETYTNIYQASYGSPEVDHTAPQINKAIVGDDRKSVRLIIDGLQIGHVHELHADGVRSSKGLPLLHPAAYYTLNQIPIK
ncbi:MAG: hypothetical protein O2955_13450 [Planctomycetota bacterium]|nr:hypothetical protein [Planctomycetota bacterium]MDA1213516.1 hypothetical protein [Planctomycetota bacterium]